MNQAQGTINLFVGMITDFSFEKFMQKFQNVVAVKLELVDSRGEVHKVDFADIMKMEWTEFEDNEEKEKATKQIA